MAEMLGGSGESLNKLVAKLEDKLKPPKLDTMSEKEKAAEVLFKDALSSLIDNKQSSVIQILKDFKGLLEPKHWGGKGNKPTYYFLISPFPALLFSNQISSESIRSVDDCVDLTLPYLTQT